MATRLYFPSAGSAPVSPAINPIDWNAHTNVARRPLNAVNGGSVMATIAYTPDAADHLVAGRAHVVQFVSDPLPPQAVPAQQVKLQLRAAEANAGNNLVVAWKVYAVNEDGSAVLGALVPIREDALEVATALTNRGDSATSQALTLPQNWRMVVEIGLAGTPAAASGVQGHNGSLSFGEDAAADLPEDDAATTTGNPWLQFARNLKIGTGSNVVLSSPGTCAGGGHVLVTAQANGGTIFNFVYETEELNDPLPVDAIRDTILGLLRLHNANNSGAQAASELAAGFVLVI